MVDASMMRECIDRWRKQLLDLTGRNRMLFYRRSRASIELQRNESLVRERLNEGTPIELDEKWLLPELISEEDKPK